MIKSEPIHILLVEDDPAHSEAVRRALKASGMNVVVQPAGTLKEYRELAAAHPPDIAIMDLSLPDGRAPEVLISPPEAGPFPIVVMSSQGDEQKAVEAMKAGALDYIVKSPEAFAGMPRAVERVLHGWDILQERKRAEEALRESEERFRVALKNSSIIVAMVDRDLRYTWIYNPHPDFNPMMVIGKRDDELAKNDGVNRLVHLKEQVIETGVGMRAEIAFPLTERILTYDITAEPLRDATGQVMGVTTSAMDITERKLAEEDIRRKAKELQEKNEELTRSTHAVSHDLRSPLVTIQTFQGHLEKDIRSQDAARVEKDLGYIRNAADKMGRLLDDIRRLSRVGRIINPSEEAPLQAIVKEALDLVAGRISRRGVKVQVTEESVVLYGDRTRLVEIFLNLVDNAAKFMGDQPAPRVEIGVEQAGEELVLHVRDNGIGIDPELQSLVFGLFHKLDPGSEGEGIGLALVKRIVEVHGGRIWVESEGPGKGTTFRFTLANMRRGVGREERT